MKREVEGEVKRNKEYSDGNEMGIGHEQVQRGSACRCSIHSGARREVMRCGAGDGAAMVQPKHHQFKTCLYG